MEVFSKHSSAVKVPTHDDLGKEFIRLKSLYLIIDKYLIETIKTLIRDRCLIDKFITMYFSELLFLSSWKLVNF